jgi:hypothetical protein
MRMCEAVALLGSKKALAAAGAEGRVTATHLRGDEEFPVRRGHWLILFRLPDAYLEPRMDLDRDDLHLEPEGPWLHAIVIVDIVRAARRSHRGKKLGPVWSLIQPRVVEWLDENGIPEPNSGELATFETFIHDLLARRRTHRAESTVRSRARAYIEAYKKLHA